MVILSSLTTLVFAYLLGSVPTGYLVGRARGIDVRTVGSGNIGATNVSRALGKPMGVLVLVADGFKGWAAVVLGTRLIFGLFGMAPEAEMRVAHEIVAGLGAVLGHNYTCWLRFKGGKGIATSAGVLLALMPWSLLVIAVVWVVVFALTRYVSLASILASFTLPFASWLTGDNVVLVVVGAAMAVMAIYKHRENIARLLKGTETRYRPKEARS